MNNQEIAKRLVRLARSLVSGAYTENDDYASTPLGKRDEKMSDYRDGAMTAIARMKVLLKNALKDAKSGKYDEWDEEMEAGRGNAVVVYKRALDAYDAILDMMSKHKVSP